MLNCKDYLLLPDLKTLHQIRVASFFLAMRYSQGYGWCRESFPRLSSPWALQDSFIMLILIAISSSKVCSLGWLRILNIAQNRNNARRISLLRVHRNFIFQKWFHFQIQPGNAIIINNPFIVKIFSLDFDKKYCRMVMYLEKG